MNRNEMELERAGYDNWKLQSGDGAMRKHFFTTRERLGKCPYCDDNVYDDQLYVEEDEVYHFSCHNEMKREEEEID